MAHKLEWEGDPLLSTLPTFVPSGLGCGYSVPGRHYARLPLDTAAPASTRYQGPKTIPDEV